MDRIIQKQAQISVSELDRDARENILLLDQKLRGLRAEIEAKLLRPSFYSEENFQKYLVKLNSISEEINAAINGLDTLIKLINSEDSEQQSLSFKNDEEMRQFCVDISTSLNEITEIKKEF
jgi:hypothetical protein